MRAFGQFKRPGLSEMLGVSRWNRPARSLTLVPMLKTESGRVLSVRLLVRLQFAKRPSHLLPDARIEHSLLQRFWLVARREEGSIAAALFDPTSNNATSQKRCNPWGKGRFVLRLRCLLGRGSLRIHSLARASPQAKPPLCKLYSILPSGE